MTIKWYFIKVGQRNYKEMACCSSVFFRALYHITGGSSILHIMSVGFCQCSKGSLCRLPSSLETITRGPVRLKNYLGQVSRADCVVLWLGKTPNGSRYLAGS